MRSTLIDTATETFAGHVAGSFPCSDRIGPLEVTVFSFANSKASAFAHVTRRFSASFLNWAPWRQTRDFPLAYQSGAIASLDPTETRCFFTTNQIRLTTSERHSLSSIRIA
ncbi:hypothetical protein RRSWK_01121 [Rhodopirellula sp. SWK7]|nr:hypothetical protein RRSWK_01121 [Rhodopirellula sp. SWK7]